MKSLKQKLAETHEKLYIPLDLLSINPLFPKEGIESGSIIELLGGSHSGKSYLSYKLAINTIIKSNFNAKVLYIETKNHFDPRQCTNLSHELLNKIGMDNTLTFDKILNSIKIIRTSNWKEYVSLIVNNLNDYLDSSNDVSLIIIDEFLQLNRLSEGLSDNLKTQLILVIAQSIQNLIKNNSKLSIVICSKIMLPNNNSKIEEFGFNRIVNTNTDIWSSIPTHRIWLYRYENKRRALLLKSIDNQINWINLS